MKSLEELEMGEIVFVKREVFWEIDGLRMKSMIHDCEFIADFVDDLVGFERSEGVVVVDVGSSSICSCI